MLLTERASELALPTERCPDWVIPNEGGSGYYHVAYSPESLDLLQKRGWKALQLSERLAIVRDMRALTSAGKLGAGDTLGRIPELLKDPSPYILRSALFLVATLPDSLIPEARRPAFARFVQRTFGARARALGWRPKTGEDEQIRLVRPLLLSLVADRGEDKALRAEASALAVKWLDDPEAIDPDLIVGVLSVAARQGDRALFDRMLATAKKERDQRRRTHLLRAMASFRDPAIVQASLGVVLTDDFDVRDAMILLNQDDRNVDVVFAFLKDRFDALMAKLPAEVGGWLPGVGEPFCDAGKSADLQAFFKDRVGKLPGGTRVLAQAVERIALCSALRDAQAASLSGFLGKY